MSKSADLVQKRWEDVTPIWTGPSYADRALQFSADVKRARLGSRLITCVDVLDWDGDGGRDVLMSNWDACYDGGVFLRREIGVRNDGTPVLGQEERVEGVHGYVTSVRDSDVFHLIATSRLRPTLLFYRNIGTRTEPRFAEGLEIALDVDWVKGGEVLHMARFADIDGDGKPELIVGTDYWHDYFPHGLEWNEEGYRAFDAAGRWLGGPLRGFAYVFKNEGTPAEPKFGRGKAISAGNNAMEVYGQLSLAFGDFHGTGRVDLVAGEFLNVLHYARNRGEGSFDAADLLRGADGKPLLLDHCIHFPCAVDWRGSGKPLKTVWRVRPTITDWEGVGRISYVTLDEEGALASYDRASPTELVNKTVLRWENGEPIRFTEDIGGGMGRMKLHACRWTGSDRIDLLIGTHGRASIPPGPTGMPRHTTGQAAIMLLRNVGNGRFGQPVAVKYKGEPIQAGMHEIGVEAVDWKGDGTLDILVGIEDGSVVWLPREDLSW